MYLPFIDESFAADQSERAWDSFGESTLFGWLYGFREFEKGNESSGDVDSGPLVFGISPAATGFIIADASRRGKTVPLRGLLRTAELVGFTFRGRYLFAPLIGDAIVLAAKTSLQST